MNRSIISTSISIEIRSFTQSDIEPLNEMFFRINESGMTNYFHPHPFTMEYAKYICTHVKKDWYSGVFINEKEQKNLAGYIMLRGWDEGFEIPSLGICILPEFQNIGIGKVLIHLALSFAKLRGCEKVRIKVNQDNKKALVLYRKIGFVFSNQITNNEMVGFFEFTRGENYE